MKIVRDLDIQPGDPGPSTEIVGIRCDLCGAERGVAKREHTARIDLDDGGTIHRADLCPECLADVHRVLASQIPKMRPVTEWTRGGIRSWGYDEIDSESGTQLHRSSICDEGLWERIS